MTYQADRTERLDRFLVRVMPEYSRTKLAALAAGGGVIVEGKARRGSFMVQQGWSVEVETPPESEAHDLAPVSIPLEVLYEDDDLLVINKPRGLAVHPAATLKEPSLVNALLARPHGLSGAAGDFRPGIVHRLDKDTTGAIVVAKNDPAHLELARQIEGKTAERRYLAVVAGDLSRERFTVDAPIGRDEHHRVRMAVSTHGRRSVTHVKRLRRIDAGTLIAVRLETGRTHQIRVHLTAVGHPVLGDRLYAPKEWQGGVLQLHAAFLAFIHPLRKETMSFYATPPDDFLGRDFADVGSLEPF